MVGKNGAGKSTMLKILAGLQSPTGGVVSVPKETTIGYLPQQMQLKDERTVREEAELAFDHIHEMEREIERLNNELAERTDYESEAYHGIIDKVTHLSEQFQMAGGNNYHAELERTLLGLGFKREDFDRQTNEFSGGWRMRIELAKLLLRRPDVLLLDEPTNHLDIESIQWLENFIQTRANAVILVSHDRAFIDNTTSRTIEIELGHIYDYKVKYSEYVVLRKERREQQLRAYENQQKKLADTEAFIERFRYKATKSTQVQSRIKQLEKIDRIEVDEIDTAMLSLKFPPAPHCGQYPVIAEEVAKRYGNHLVFEHVNLIIKRGEKVAFVGKNGEGKSTLVKCIMDEIPYEGSLKLAQGVKIGYFAQNQAQLLDENLTVFDTVDYVAKGDIRTKIRDILGAFMFGGEASDKKVKVLSGGEKSRLAMIRLFLEPVNLLILDEPTVGLDPKQIIEIRELIRNLAKKHTVILSSHILAEVREVCDYIMIISGGKLVASDTTENLENMMSGKGQIEVEAKASRDEMDHIIRRTGKIKEVKYRTSASGITTAQITAKGGEDIREELFLAFSHADVPMLTLNQSKTTLEEIFLELTQGSGNRMIKEEK